jgi:hypothetical protein
MYKNIICECEDDININSVVALKKDPHGRLVPVKYCGSNAVRCPKHARAKEPIIVKPKKNKKFAVEFICIGTHRDEFEPIKVVLQAKLKSSLALVESPEFTLIGSRDHKRITDYANSQEHFATPPPIPPDRYLSSCTEFLPEPDPLPDQNETVQRANPPPASPLNFEELFSLPTSTDPGNQDYSVEESIDLNSTQIDSENHYVDFMRSRL